jgi:hypothetical protein
VIKLMPLLVKLYNLYDDFVIRDACFADDYEYVLFVIVTILSLMTYHLITMTYPDYTGSCKSNYHTTTATTAPINCRKTDVERQTVNAYSQINKDNKTYKIKPPLIVIRWVLLVEQELCNLPDHLILPR